MRCSRFGAIKGRQYWSVAEGAWRILITEATSLDGHNLEGPRPNFTLSALRSGKDLYFAQRESRYRRRHLSDVSPCGELTGACGGD